MDFKNIKNFRTKKSLGQNFLNSQNILRSITAAGDVKSDDTVLEIGPGKGTLTKLLLQTAGKVVAVETDYGLFELLQDKFTDEIKDGRLELSRGDILKFDPSSLKKYKIIANIPYNITGAILEHFLTAENQPELMVLLVQKEVAQRIASGPRPSGARKESILSISVKAYGKPKIIGKVSKRFFSPPPKVDSAILKISEISRENFVNSGINEEKFFQIVRGGFQHKRKKLENNLKNVISEANLLKLGLKNKRAEDLSPEEWFFVAKA